MDYQQLLDTSFEWLKSNPELLVVSCYGAGDRDYLLCRSTDDVRWLCENTAPDYPACSICLYADPKLPVRGLVNATFAASAIASVPDNTSVLVLCLDPLRDRRLCGNFCDNHRELETELNDWVDSRVAVGPLDDWDDFDPRHPNEKRFATTTLNRRA